MAGATPLYADRGYGRIDTAVDRRRSGKTSTPGRLTVGHLFANPFFHHLDGRSPCNCASRLRSAQVASPCARTRRFFGSRRPLSSASGRSSVRHRLWRAQPHYARHPNGDFEAVLASEIDGVDHIGSASAAGNQGRPLVDEPVVDLSGVLVPDVFGAQDWSREVPESSAATSLPSKNA